MSMEEDFDISKLNRSPFIIGFDPATGDYKRRITPYESRMAMDELTKLMMEEYSKVRIEEETEDMVESLRKFRERGTASTLKSEFLAFDKMSDDVRRSLLKAWLSEPAQPPMWPLSEVSDIENSRLYAMSCAETPALNALRESVERRKKLLWLDSLDIYPIWESTENINKYKNGSK